MLLMYECVRVDADHVRPHICLGIEVNVSDAAIATLNVVLAVRTRAALRRSTTPCFPIGAWLANAGAVLDVLSRRTGRRWDRRERRSRRKVADVLLALRLGHAAVPVRVQVQKAPHEGRDLRALGLLEAAVLILVPDDEHGARREARARDSRRQRRVRRAREALVPLLLRWLCRGPGLQLSRLLPCGARLGAQLRVQAMHAPLEILEAGILVQVPVLVPLCVPHREVHRAVARLALHGGVAALPRRLLRPQPRRGLLQHAGRTGLGAHAGEPGRVVQVPLEVLERRAPVQGGVPVGELDDARLHHPQHLLVALLPSDGRAAALGRPRGAGLGAHAGEPGHAVQVALDVLERRAAGQGREPLGILRDAHLHRPLHLLVAGVVHDGGVADRVWLDSGVTARATQHRHLHQLHVGVHLARQRTSHRETQHEMLCVRVLEQSSEV
mmetsp:Transcript_96470/g.254780  ORF Transcript_96470/g.254780 Transcript_96470/m.254780 type:complete len:441 (+) Transcript_96470:859-2181(+)